MLMALDTLRNQIFHFRVSAYELLPMIAKPKLHSALAQQAYEHVKVSILEGRLAPEDKLSVVALADQLGCSRVPVMEALKRLESDGFVQIVPQVGCKIVSPDVRDVMDFFRLFAAAEGMVTRFAAERRSQGDLAAFSKLCKQIDSLTASAGAPTAEDPSYRRLNLLFHGEIHRMADSPLASDIAASFWDRSDFYIKIAFGSLYFSTRVKRAHRLIRRAIIDGDGDAAEREVRAHLYAVGDGVVRRLQELGDSVGDRESGRAARTRN